VLKVPLSPQSINQQVNIKLCGWLYVADRNIRIDDLQKHVCDLVRQREKLQFQETHLHDKYEQVSHEQVSQVHTGVISTNNKYEQVS